MAVPTELALGVEWVGGKLGRVVKGLIRLNCGTRWDNRLVKFESIMCFIES